jgi:hypothetical protein
MYGGHLVATCIFIAIVAVVVFGTIGAVFIQLKRRWEERKKLPLHQIFESMQAYYGLVEREDLVGEKAEDWGHAILRVLQALPEENVRFLRFIAQDAILNQTLPPLLLQGTPKWDRMDLLVSKACLWLREQCENDMPPTNVVVEK